MAASQKMEKVTDMSNYNTLTTANGAPVYEPNSYENTPKQNCTYAEPALDLGNVKADRYAHRQGNDDYTQAGDLYRLMTPDAQARLVENIVGSLGDARQDIQMRQLCHFFRADVNYGMQIAQALGIHIAPLMISAAHQRVGV